MLHVGQRQLLCRAELSTSTWVANSGALRSRSQQGPHSKPAHVGKKKPVVHMKRATPLPQVCESEETAPAIPQIERGIDSSGDWLVQASMTFSGT